MALRKLLTGIANKMWQHGSVFFFCLLICLWTFKFLPSSLSVTHTESVILWVGHSSDMLKSARSPRIIQLGMHTADKLILTFRLLWLQQWEWYCTKLTKQPRIFSWIYLSSYELILTLDLHNVSLCYAVHFAIICFHPDLHYCFYFLWSLGLDLVKALKVLALSWSWYTMVLVLTWSRVNLSAPNSALLYILWVLLIFRTKIQIYKSRYGQTSEGVDVHKLWWIILKKGRFFLFIFLLAQFIICRQTVHDPAKVELSQILEDGSVHTPPCACSVFFSLIITGAFLLCSSCCCVADTV